MINIILPLMGCDEPFGDSIYPKPLAMYGDESLLSRAVSYVTEGVDANLISVIPSSLNQKFHLSLVVEQSAKACTATSVLSEGATSGSMCTCLLAADAICLDDELVILDYDQLISLPLLQIIQRLRDLNADFGGVSFASTHPKWSYVELDKENRILRCEEKVPISSNALCGIYYFKTARSFIESAERCLLGAPKSKTVFYNSETFNQLLLEGLHGFVVHIQQSQSKKISDPNQLWASDFNDT